MEGAAKAKEPMKRTQWSVASLLHSCPCWCQVPFRASFRGQTDQRAPQPAKRPATCLNSQAPSPAAARTTPVGPGHCVRPDLYTTRPRIRGSEIHSPYAVPSTASRPDRALSKQRLASAYRPAPKVRQDSRFAAGGTIQTSTRPEFRGLPRPASPVRPTTSRADWPRRVSCVRAALAPAGKRPAIAAFSHLRVRDPG